MCKQTSPPGTCNFRCLCLFAGVVRKAGREPLQSSKDDLTVCITENLDLLSTRGLGFEQLTTARARPFTHRRREELRCAAQMVSKT